ncbi:MAG: hypothetical protein LBQ44_05195, partial [Treponema sp.]|nr:hypothetical protein [Treponema sp.]
ILVTKESALNILSLVARGTITGNVSDMELLKKRISTLKFNRYQNTDYINLSKGVNIKITEQ